MSYVNECENFIEGQLNGIKVEEAEIKKATAENKYLREIIELNNKSVELSQNRIKMVRVAIKDQRLQLRRYQRTEMNKESGNPS